MGSANALKGRLIKKPSYLLTGTLLFLLIPAAAGCRLPGLEVRDPSPLPCLEESSRSSLGKAVSALSEGREGKSGIYSLENPRRAFAARILLAEKAELTLDLQYFIWRRDKTGILLLEALRQAGERGVRVRLLLDDLGTNGLDRELAALNSHPNIEVRLFNPFAYRRFKWIGFFTDFHRANRRMHNKSFTADNSVAIVGGRNVGDDYFGAGDGLMWIDLDVLVAGPAATDTAGDFALYWDSRSAWPAGKVLPAPGEGDLKELSRMASELKSGPGAEEFLESVESSEFIEELILDKLDMEWAPARIVSDDPAKGVGEAEPEGLLLAQLEEVIGLPSENLCLISPYFVPTREGAAAFSGISEEGVRVRILTNSLAATNFLSVHAGYARSRRKLLEAGVELYEKRPVQITRERQEPGPIAGSVTSLHAKTFAVDCKRVFVGSLNFNPRSVNLDTELGLVIESPRLAEKIQEAFDSIIPANSYRVDLDKRGRLFWTGTTRGRASKYRREPGAGFLKRIGACLLSYLPVEWVL